jgi:hypothetical protein
VSLSQIVIKAQRRFRLRDCLGESFLWRARAIGRQHVVAIGQTRASRGIVRVQLESFGKETGSFFDGLGCPLVPGVASSHVKRFGLSSLFILGA